MASLKKYQEKRNFQKTKEPKGKIKLKKGKLCFVVQHHMARKEHFDLRLEWNGVLKSFAVPYGLSYNPKVKRLAIMVEEHPYSYRNFEGVISKGEYGAGTVMVFDRGNYEPVGNVDKELKKGILKFKLMGKRLKGMWSLVHLKEKEWLLIKENDDYVKDIEITSFKTSIKTGRTMEEIKENKKNLGIEVTNPQKIIYPKTKTTKQDLINYYKKVGIKMLPYVQNRLFSSIRCPDCVENDKFFKKHFENNDRLKKVTLKNKNDKKENYYYIFSITGIIEEVQNNGYEFHIWGSEVSHIKKPNMMVFDLDPDEKLSLKEVRQGVKDLKKLLDDFNLISFLKTSGGKGYHVVVPISSLKSWKKFREVAQSIAKLMEVKYPNKYVSVMSKEKRENKIFIDWIRNTYGATSVAPYSVRLRDKPTVSMPIFWSELDKIKPDEITIDKALKRLNKKDPWENFFDIIQ